MIGDLKTYLAIHPRTSRGYQSLSAVKYAATSCQFSTRTKPVAGGQLAVNRRVVRRFRKLFVHFGERREPEIPEGIVRAIHGDVVFV